MTQLPTFSILHRFKLLLGEVPGLTKSGIEHLQVGLLAGFQKVLGGFGRDQHIGLNTTGQDALPGQAAVDLETLAPGSQAVKREQRHHCHDQ